MSELYSYLKGRRARGAIAPPPPPPKKKKKISDEVAKPCNISEDGAKNGLEYARGVEIHPLSFYLTN